MTAEEESHSGACHCGAVRYRVSGAPQFQFLCHCDNCRKINGGMRLAGVTFPDGAFTVEGVTSVYRYAGGKGEIETHFCGKCGTPLYAHPKIHAGMVVVRANTLSDPASFAPVKSIYGHRACAWETVIGA
jgi:hypothetical protein